MNRNFLLIERFFKTVYVDISVPVLAGRLVRNLCTPAINNKLLNSFEVNVVYRRCFSPQWNRHSTKGTRELTRHSKELKFCAFSNSVIHSLKGTGILTGETVIEKQKLCVFSNSVLHKFSVRHYCSDLNSEDAGNNDNNIGEFILGW